MTARGRLARGQSPGTALSEDAPRKKGRAPYGEHREVL